MFGDIIRYDYPNVQKWYDLIVAFPPKLYMEMNRFVTAALQMCFADPLSIDEEEPFGVLMVYPFNVVWRLVTVSPTVYLRISSH